MQMHGIGSTAFSPLAGPPLLSFRRVPAQTIRAHIVWSGSGLVVWSLLSGGGVRRKGIMLMRVCVT
jgi:hypothetical protein